MEKLPVFSVDLIKELDKEFPESSPEPSHTDREIWMRAGERRIVRMLLARVKQIEEDNLLEN